MPTMMVRLKSGVTLGCRVDGVSEGPWILLSNSLCTDTTLWDDLVGVLGQNYRILRYDPRGHGLSPAVTGPYSMDQLVEDAVGLLDHFGIERAHVCGISMGGGVAVGLAVNHPSRVLSMIMCDSMGGRGTGTEWNDRIAAALKGGMKPLVEPTVTRWFTQASQAANHPAIGRVRAMIAGTSTAGFVGCCQALQTYDYRGRLAEIKVPALLIAGAEDGNRPQLMQALARRIANSRYVTIPAAGHLPNIENPNAFNAVVRNFLDVASKR